jgi:hypothetical protein
LEEVIVNRSDVYDAITDRVIAAIEEGAGEWQMPWHRSGVSRPLNAHTKKPYRGVNVIALWVAADTHEYSTGFWATYKQWHELRAQVRKGERASLIVFWKELEREVENEQTGERERKKTLFAPRPSIYRCAADLSLDPPELLLSTRLPNHRRSAERRSAWLSRNRNAKQNSKGSPSSRAPKPSMRCSTRRSVTQCVQGSA